jgi:serine/threonine protein kinase
MGAVYVAEHLKLRKQVAIKVIRAEFAEQPCRSQPASPARPSATAQRRSPARRQRDRLRQPPGGGAYLVIQLVRGVSLRQHLERTAGSAGRRLRDRRPDRRRPRRRPRDRHRPPRPQARQHPPRARDDGRYHAASSTSASPASSGDIQRSPRPTACAHPHGHAILGHPRLHGPRAGRRRAVDARGDLYALGVILWESIAGRTLWRGDSLTEIVTGQLAESPPLLAADAKAGLPPGFEPLILRLCALRQGDRPADAREVRDALLDLLKGTGTSTHAARDSISAPAAARPERRRALAIAGAAALALVIVTSILSLAGDDAPRAAAPAAAPADAAPAAAHRPASKPQANDPPATPPGKRPIPAALRGAAAALSSANDPDARQRAAALVIAHRPLSELPDYLSLLARVESSRRCDEKIRALRALGKTDDRRALAGLSKIAPGSCDPELTRELNAARAALSE